MRLGPGQALAEGERITPILNGQLQHAGFRGSAAFTHSALPHFALPVAKTRRLPAAS